MIKEITAFIDKIKFKRMTPAQKRVAIAADVLSRLEVAMLIPHSGDLFGGDLFRRVNSDDGDDSGQALINSIQCEACAKGALVCSWVGNFNKATVGDLECYDFDLEIESYPEELLKLFGRDQLDLIEAHFEGTVFEYSSDATATRVLEIDAADRVGDYCFESAYEGKLKKIMKNIIKNEGTFIP